MNLTSKEGIKIADGTNLKTSLDFPGGTDVIIRIRRSSTKGRVEIREGARMIE